MEAIVASSSASFPDIPVIMIIAIMTASQFVFGFMVVCVCLWVCLCAVPLYGMFLRLGVCLCLS